MTAPDWRHRVEYGLARAVASSISALPDGVADAVGRRLGRTAYRLGIRRSAAENNLALAFPEADPDWQRDIALGAYEHLGREAVAMLHLARMDVATIREHTLVQGWDEVEGGLDEGRGVIFATGHFGNWEVAAASVAARGVPMAAIVKRQHNPLVNTWVDDIRRGLGIETITRGAAPRRVPRFLRAGGAVGIVGDQDAGRSGVFVPFFGRAASTHRGAALFALRLGAPLFASTARRLPGPEVRYELTAERIEITRTGDLEADTLRLTAAIAARLEAAVRSAPEQYFWFHRRWKTTPPEELNSVRVSNI